MRMKWKALHQTEIITEKIRVLDESSPSPTPAPESCPAFRLGLADTGFSKGRNAGVEHRWADQAECDSFKVR